MTLNPLLAFLPLPLYTLPLYCYAFLSPTFQQRHSYSLPPNPALSLPNSLLHPIRPASLTNLLLTSNLPTNPPFTLPTPSQTHPFSLHSFHPLRSNLFPSFLISPSLKPSAVSSTMVCYSFHSFHFAMNFRPTLTSITLFAESSYVRYSRPHYKPSMEMTASPTWADLIQTFLSDPLLSSFKWPPPQFSWTSRPQLPFYPYLPTWLFPLFSPRCRICSFISDITVITRTHLCPIRITNSFNFRSTNVIVFSSSRRAYTRNLNSLFSFYFLSIKLI